MSDYECIDLSNQDWNSSDFMNETISITNCTEVKQHFEALYQPPVGFYKRDFIIEKQLPC